MRLHRTEAPDWSGVAPGQLSGWQRLAAGTNGVVTPANAISLLGGLLVVYGLYDVLHHQLAAGIIIILLGRVADVLDGMVAEATHTRSPFGEAVDATLDKILLALALIVLLDKQLLPLVVGLIMLAQAAYNSVAALLARRHGLKLHPSEAGKLSAVFEWLSIGLYSLAYQAGSYHPTARRAGLVAAALSFGLFVILGILASAGYSEQITNKAIRR